MVANDFGAVTSQVATLSIENTAPGFAPTRDYVLTTPGGDASLDSAVFGSGPMTFQWYFDGLALPGATNETLFLRGITAEQAGRYRLAATNSLGGAIGPEIELILTSISQVIHIAGEGLGGTYLGGALWAEPERYPNFSKLVREGSSTMNARCDFTETITVPNYVSIFTGRPVRQPDGQPDTVHHGFLDNFPSSGWILHDRGNTNVPYKTSVFDVAHDHGLKTAFLFGKSTISMCAE